MRFSAVLGALSVLFVMTTGSVAAAPVMGVPVDGEMGFQAAATPVMENITWFHNMLLWIITAISLLVLGLLVWVIVRYNAKSNPTPSKFSHNTLVEVVWTAAPIVILIIIAVPSFQLLYYQDTIPESDFTIKTTGYQWNWGYEYPDHGGFEYFSNMVADEDIAAHPFEAHRNLTTDLPVVVPAGATVRVEVTAADVIHNWAMPAFGIKMDAIPGRLNETWFRVDEPGIYYGQCSELCGVRHAFMPIEVHVVPQDVFDAWVEAANEDPYSAPEVLVAHYDALRGGTRVAAAQ
ncbi:MAG: cytochrome c oxidase subunit II [Alphaproteobacteria bacterium]|nr:cytochrome c oxidase subunit II [Alphaproteobacteria bacterium]